MESYLILSHQPTGFPSPPEVMESDAERVAFEPPSLEVTGGWVGKRFHSDLKIASIEAMKETNL